MLQVFTFDFWNMMQLSKNKQLLKR